VDQRQRVLVDLAVQLLREAVEANRTPKSTTAVRLALRVLLPHCPERWPLAGFWDGMNGSHEIGRQQTMTASLNGILCQLEKSGWRPSPKAA
jgi:hypothetical protein